MKKDDKNTQVQSLIRNKKLLKFYKSLDNHIKRNFEDAGIQTRHAGSNGLWCCALLPTIMLTYSWMFHVTPVYRLAAYLSVGMLCYSILFILFLSVSCLVLRENIYGGCIASGIISTLLIYIIMDKSFIYSATFPMISIIIYSFLLRLSLTKFQKTFTIGEAMVVSQGLVLFGAAAFAKTPQLFKPNDDESLIFTIVFTVLSTVGLIVTALYFLYDTQRNFETLMFITLAAAGFVLVALHLFMGPTCVLRILQFILGSDTRKYLFFFWLCLLGLAVVIVLVRTRLSLKATTSTRKSFHILGSIVFLSGILVDEDLMMFGAGIALGVLIFIEALRKSGIEPISSALQSAFIVYSDEKDCGWFAMSPLYLFAGLACPLALVPRHAMNQLELLSGVLADGVGDSAASWLGARYGRCRWPDSNRTLEGTTFNIVAQVAVVYVLDILDLLKSNFNLPRAMLASVVSGMVEAQTEQVDNLVLPLVTIMAYQATCFLVA